MKKTPKILPTYYQSKGTPIFRDTTALPFAQGGRLAFEPSEYGSDAREQYDDGGKIYTYSKRPGSYYKKTEDGWLINNSSTGGKYVPIDDPTGERAALLSKYAKPQAGINKIYADPLSRNSETTQAVAAKTTPQTQEQRDNIEEVKRINRQRQSDLNKALQLEGYTPEQATSIIGSYGSDWPTLETAKARDIQIMNKTAADIQAGINPSSMQSFTPRAAQPLMDRVQDIAFNPFTAAGYAVRGQEIPEYLQEKADSGTLGYWSNGQFVEGRNALDTAVDIATPIGWAHSADNIVDRATNDKSGDFWTEENAWDALNILPGLGLAKGAKAVDAVKDINTAANTGLTQLGNTALDLAQRTRIVPKSTAAELAIDAGNLVREPFYAPQRPSLLNPAIAPNNIKALPSLSSQGYSGIMPKYTQDQLFNAGSEKALAVPSFLPQTIKELAATGNVNELRSAEDWLNSWISHPATQAKMQKSLQDNLGVVPSSVNLTRNEETGELFNPAERIQNKQAFAANQQLAYNELANYNSANKLQYYPKTYQIQEALVPSMTNIHQGNRGVDYTHSRQPENFVDSPAMPKQDNPEGYRRYGTYVSRLLNPEQTKTVGIHEGLHNWATDFSIKSLGQFDKIKDIVQPTYDQELLDIKNREAKLGVLDIKKKKQIKEDLENLEYQYDPTEIHARIMQMRHALDLKPDDIITADKAQEYINLLNNNQIPGLRSDGGITFKNVLKDPKQTARLFNELWMTVPAIGGATLLNNEETEKNYAKGGFLYKYPFGGDLVGEPVTPVQPTTPPDTNPVNPTAVNAAGVQDFYTNWYSKRTLPFAEIGNKQYEKVMRSVLPAYNPQSPLLNDITQKAVPYEVQPMIEGDPNATGALVYNKQGMPEKIQLKESILGNPKELDSTLVHEEHTRIMNPFADKVLPAEQMIINPSIKTFEEGWGNLKGDAADAAGEYYDYITDPQGGNIQSMLFEVRKSKNLQPNQVITDQDIESWKQEAEQSGALDPNNANYDNALYNLFKLGKDNESIKNLFNYIASNKTQQPNAMSGSMNNMG